MEELFRTLGVVFLGGLLWVQTVLFLPQQLGDQSNVDIYDRSGPGSSYEQVARGLHLVEVRGAQREWELWADQADKRAGVQDWDLTSVKAQFYGRESLRYHVLGQTGSVTESQQDMEIEGDVKTLSSDGYVFEAEAVYYDSKDRVLVSPGEVMLRGTDGEKSSGASEFNLEGEGLRAYVDKSLIVIENNVRARALGHEGKVLRISGNSATIRGDEKTVVFEGAVQIQHESMSVRGPRASFYFEGEGPSSVLSKVVVRGGVRMRDGDRQGTSDTLTLLVPQERAEMEGNPRVVQGEDVLQGHKIVFLDGGQRVQVERARVRVEQLEGRGKE